MIELKAPPGKIRVVRTGLVGGRHDYEELVKDCDEIKEALDLITTNYAQRKGNEVYFGYDDRGGCVATLALKENG